MCMHVSPTPMTLHCAKQLLVVTLEGKRSILHVQIVSPDYVACVLDESQALVRCCIEWAAKGLLPSETQ